MDNLEVCTGFQESEEELQEFLKENPDFPHEDPLSIGMENAQDEK